MAYIRTRRPRGLGASVATTVETSYASAALSAPVLAATGGLSAISGLVAEFLAAFGVGSGCGQTCVLSSDYANQAQSLLTQNVQAYVALPGPRSAADQQTALSNFNQIWNDLSQQCSNPSLGSAGQNCISQRQQGACYFKTSPGGWQQQNGTWVYVWPGANGSGSTCWNYFVGFHDPIANDPDVASATSSVSSALSSGGSSTLILLAAAALIVLGLVQSL